MSSKLMKMATMLVALLVPVGCSGANAPTVSEQTKSPPDAGAPIKDTSAVDVGKEDASTSIDTVDTGRLDEPMSDANEPTQDCAAAYHTCIPDASTLAASSLCETNYYNCWAAFYSAEAAYCNEIGEPIQACGYAYTAGVFSCIANCWEADGWSMQCYDVCISTGEDC